MKRRLILVTVVVLTVVVVASWARQQMAVESRDQAVTEDDLRILQRADSLLKDVSVWNRHDDRACADDEAAGKWSLFCALQKADREILGEYQHRNVALQEVRFAIQDATRDRQTEMVIRALRNSVCLIGSWTLTIFPKHGLRMLSRCYGSRPNVSEHG